MSNVDINVDRRTDGLTDGRTENRTPISHPATSRCDKKSQGQSFCVKVYKTSYFEDPLMDFIHIWHVGRYRSKVFISTIPTPGVTLGTRSRT